MKKLFSALALIMTSASGAATLDCHWMKTGDLAEGFYKPAHIKMQLSDSEVSFIEDTYTSRRYEPCWVGNHSSCYFGFDYERGQPWETVGMVEHQSGTSLTIQSSWYWTAEMSWNFATNVGKMKPGEVTTATVSGDDGDGVWFHDHKFACTKK